MTHRVLVVVGDKEKKCQKKKGGSTSKELRKGRHALPSRLSACRPPHDTQVACRWWLVTTKFLCFFPLSLDQAASQWHSTQGRGSVLRMLLPSDWPYSGRGGFWIETIFFCEKNISPKNAGSCQESRALCSRRATWCTDPKTGPETQRTREGPETTEPKTISTLLRRLCGARPQRESTNLRVERLSLNRSQ